MRLCDCFVVIGICGCGLGGLLAGAASDGEVDVLESGGEGD